MNLSLSRATRIGLNLVAVLGVAILLYLGKSIFIPLIIAGLLAAILWPMASFLHERLRFGWFFSCILVVMGAVVASVAIFFSLGIAIPGLVQDITKLTSQESYDQLRVHVREHYPFFYRPDIFPENAYDSRFYQSVRNAFAENNLTQALLSVASVSAKLLFEATLILFILLFLLLEGKMLLRRVKDIFGSSIETQGQVAVAGQQIVRSLRSYLIWRTAINVVLGVMLGFVYSWMGLKQAWTWGILTMILTYIPYLGTILAGLPPLVDALFSVGPWAALAVLVGYTILVTVEGYIIVPMVMGRSMDLNATTVMLSCLVWDLVWGTPGLFLAMPLMASLKAVCMQVPEWRPWGRLMGSHEDEQDAALQKRIDEIARRMKRDESGGDSTMLIEAEPEKKA